MCGEQAYLSILYISILGSSPRVRGAGGGREDQRPVPGIIPAHAGSSWTKVIVYKTDRDHPRACGEQPSQWNSSLRVTGSSPRMRGAVIAKGGHLVRRGIIPAHAGSSGARGPSVPAVRDHPRACGEQPSMPSMASLMSGSSPRMRGAAPNLVGRAVRTGIIPAHAGSRSRCP